VPSSFATVRAMREPGGRNFPISGPPGVGSPTGRASAPRLPLHVVPQLPSHRLAWDAARKEDSALFAPRKTRGGDPRRHKLSNCPPEGQETFRPELRRRPLARAILAAGQPRPDRGCDRLLCGVPTTSWRKNPQPEFPSPPRKTRWLFRIWTPAFAFFRHRSHGPEDSAFAGL